MSETTDRHQAIVELARAENRVTVDALAAHFGVSVQTIRKDLNLLCEQRLLTRTHGGATLPSGVETSNMRPAAASRPRPRTPSAGPRRRSSPMTHRCSSISAPPPRR
jgi:DeoR/GlpR family transcriptional regulator of sugar metabolism